MILENLPGYELNPDDSGTGNSGDAVVPVFQRNVQEDRSDVMDCFHAFSFSGRRGRQLFACEHIKYHRAFSTLKK